MRSNLRKIKIISYSSLLFCGFMHKFNFTAVASAKAFDKGRLVPNRSDVNEIEDGMLGSITLQHYCSLLLCVLIYNFKFTDIIDIVAFQKGPLVAKVNNMDEI